MLDVEVHKRLGEFTLDARFNVAEAGVTALFGRSGSGKTSTVSAIAGLLRPDAGHVRVSGVTLFDASAGIEVPAHRRRIGYVFQDARLFPHLSVKDNLGYGLRRAPVAERRIALGQIVELLGLEALLARRPPQLSGGEKQRVAIGRALLAQPRILLMDEPLASLDAARKRQVLRYIERLRDELGLAIVYVSHALEEVVRLADQVVLFDAGRVAAVGSPDVLSQDLGLHDLFGESEAGVVLDARVLEHDEHFELTTLEFSGGRLRVPKIDVPVAARVRVRVRERDVSLAVVRPSGLSIQNILEGHVSEVTEERGPLAEVKVALQGTVLLARVTRESVHRLQLGKGMPVFALVKSVSFEERS